MERNFEVRDYETLQKSIVDFCRFLSDFGVSSEKIFDCRLVADELLGNVLRHTHGVARMHVAMEEGFVLLTICASAPSTPPKTSVCSDVYAEHGRGLYLVDSVCAERIVKENGDVLVRIKMG